MAVVVEHKFILELVALSALVEWHVALEELEIQQDIKAITKSIGIGFVSCNGLVFVSSIDTDPCRVPGRIPGTGHSTMKYAAPFGCTPKAGSTRNSLGLIPTGKSSS